MPITRVDLPDDALVATLPSPDYTTTYPQIEGPYELPWWAVEAVESAYAQRSFTGRSIRLYRLRRAFVCAEGLVFNADGQLFGPTAAQFGEDTITAAHRAVQQALFDRSIVEQAAPTLLCKRPTAYNYGHWMIDMLPGAHLAQAMLPDDLRPGFACLLHRTGGNMDAVMTETLGRLGIEPSRLFWTGNAPVLCHDLFVLDGVSQHGRYITPHAVACHDRIAQGIPGRGWTRLFVTRTTGLGRVLRNEAALAEMAAAEGYVVFDPGRATLAEQIAAFRDARSIIGAIGAGLTNILYSPPGAKVTLMTPRSMPDSFYWLICAVRGLVYRDLRCHEVGPEAGPGMPPWMRDTEMEPDRFRAVLAALG